MLGALLGDMAGSAYERLRVKRKDIPLFPAGARFTDDSVLTVAVAEAILDGAAYGPSFRVWARRYPYAGYGGRFKSWFMAENPPQGDSFGNGSAMRVSPVGWAFDTLDEVLAQAAQSALPTHAHPEGVKGAQAVATAVFLARTGQGREAIRTCLENRFGYDLRRGVDEIRPTYRFDSSCQGSVPEAICCFLEAADFEDALRNAISLGGDADTQACIAGAIAEAHFGVPDAFTAQLARRLPADLLAVTRRFSERYLRGAAG